jgi:amino acid transporter
MSSSDNNSDPEKAAGESVNSAQEGNGVVVGESAPKAPWKTRFVDSFRRDPNAQIINPAGDHHGEFDHKAAAERTANSGLKHKLKGRHLQMIAIGGSIGGFKHCWNTEVY